MSSRSARVSYEHVHRLTPAEELMLRQYEGERTLAALARKLGISGSCVQQRSKSIREKLGVETLQEAVEKWLPEQDSNL